MDSLVIIKAILILGTPVLLLSWLMFSWLYREGKLEKKANRKKTAGSLKDMKKASKDKSAPKENYFYNKWMWFGSGFYGLAALWTFVAMEVVDIFNLIRGFSGFGILFEGSVVQLLIKFVLNQFGNILNAFLWFNYWSPGSPFLWIIVAYLGYLGGIELAKRIDFQLPRKLIT